MKRYGIIQHGDGSLSPDLIRIYGNVGHADIYSFGAKRIFHGIYFGEQHGKEIRNLINGNGKLKDPKEIERFEEQLKLIEIKYYNMMHQKKEENAATARLYDSIAGCL